MTRILVSLITYWNKVHNIRQKEFFFLILAGKFRGVMLLKLHCFSFSIVFNTLRSLLIYICDIFKHFFI